MDCLAASGQNAIGELVADAGAALGALRGWNLLDGIFDFDLHVGGGGDLRVSCTATSWMDATRSTAGTDREVAGAGRRGSYDRTGCSSFGSGGGGNEDLTISTWKIYI